MTPVPVHLAIDLEPDERLPTGAGKTFDSAGVALEEMARRRPALEQATGAPANVGWYLRMDRHIAGLYGSASAIADRYRGALEAAAQAGDEVGLHVHCVERRADGGWRVNYQDPALVAAMIEESAAQYQSVFARPCRAARMGDMWTSKEATRQFASLGIRYDISPESGLRPESIAALYPGTGSLGRRPALFASPVKPYRDESGVWVMPLTSYPRRDFHRPGMWLVSAYSSLATGFKHNRARMVIRPQMRHAPGAMRKAIEAALEDGQVGGICVAIRNFGAADCIGDFLDTICEMAREVPMRFCAPEDYVRLAADAA